MIGIAKQMGRLLDFRSLPIETAKRGRRSNDAKE